MKILKRSLFFVLIIFFAFVLNAYGTTYYSSPSGSGSTCSDASPCSLTTGIGKLVAGDTLYLKNGTYNQSLNITKSGTSGAYITVKAQNDGQATIDANGATYACNIESKSYVNLEGVICKDSNDVTVRVRSSHHVNLKRVSGYNSATTQIFLVYLSNNVLLEDCFLKVSHDGILNVMESDYVTVRRFVVILENYTSGAQRAIQSYGGNNNIYENCIVRAHPVHSTDIAPYGLGIWAHVSNDSADNNKFYGIIVYNLGGYGVWVNSDNNLIQNNEFVNNVLIDNENGFFQRADTNLLVDHLVVVSTPDSAFKQDQDSVTKDSDWDMDGTVKNSIFLSGDTGMNKGSDPSGTTLTSRYNNFYGLTTKYSGTILDKTGDTFVNPAYDTVTYGKGAYLMYPKALVGTGENGANKGAEILYCYTNGVLTSTPLWPWPMESRICRETGYSVTYENGYSGCEKGGGLWKTLEGVYDGSPPPPPPPPPPDSIPPASPAIIEVK